MAVDDLVTWIRQQLDEDERVARTGFTHPDRWVRVPPGIPTGLSCTAVLAEVDAKRRIMELHRPVRKRSTGSGGGIVEDCQMCGHFPVQYPCATMRALALPYADRPGYRDEWAP